MNAIGRRPQPSAAAASLEASKSEILKSRESYKSEGISARKSPALDRNQQPERYNASCSALGGGGDIESAKLCGALHGGGEEASMEDFRRSYEVTAVPYEATRHNPFGALSEMRTLDLYGAQDRPVLRG